METEPSKPTVQESSPTSEHGPTLSEASASVWETYLTAKKVPATRLLDKLEAARAKAGILLPDAATKSRFAEALAAKPARVARLLDLLQACRLYSDTLRQIVLELAGAGITRLGILALPEPLDSTSFRGAISTWLGGIRKKPLKPDELKLLFLFLHFGWQRQLIDEEAAYNLVAAAISERADSGSRDAVGTEPAPTPLEVLLAATPSAPALSALLAHAGAVRPEVDTLKLQIERQASEIARLTAELIQLGTTVGQLRSEIAALTEQMTAAEKKAGHLAREIVELRDGYQHKLDDLRGKIRGMLQGQLTRWIQTALDASRSDPPWNQAIRERLEDALKLIEREAQWLQPSA